jgi:magnesium chelatase family protein
MLYKTLSAAVYGIDASIIEVEVDVSGIKSNEDYFHTVGLPDARCGRAATGCVPP